MAYGSSAPGSFIFQGMQNAGNSLAEGIQQYAKRQRADSVVQGQLSGLMGYASQNAQDLPEDLRSLTEKHVTGKTTSLQDQQLLGGLQSYMAVKQQDIQRQMQAMQMRDFQQRMQAQQAAGIRLDQLNQYASGAGTGVLQPAVQNQMQAQMADPMTRYAMQVRSITGQNPSQEALAKYIRPPIPTTPTLTPLTGGGTAVSLGNRLAIYNPKPTGQPLSPIGKLISDRNVAMKSGDTGAAASYDAAIAKESTRTGQVVTVGPDGAVQIASNVDPSALTTAAKTASQESQSRLERVIAAAGNLAINLRPEDVGLQGTAGEKLVDQGLGQLSPGSVDQSRVQNRTALRAFRESALRTVADDRRFSPRDRTAIEQMLPEDGVFESYPSAVSKLRTVTQLFAQRAGMEAGKQGVKSLAEMTPDELRQQYQQGKITRDVAKNLIAALYPDVGNPQ